jgi:hypothetical protein
VRTNDMLMLDLHTCRWSQPMTSGTAPSPRQGAAICVANGRQLLVHGGRNSFLLGDLHCLDLGVGGRVCWMLGLPQAGHANAGWASGKLKI